MGSSTAVSPRGVARRSGIVRPHAATRLQRVAAWLVANGMRFLSSTIRFRLCDGARQAMLPQEPVIFALWHNRLGLSMKMYERFVRPDASRDHLAALISASKDGALLAAILNNFGVQAVRGSSSRRGPQALVELRSWAARGYDLAITPDGPRGPRYVVQEGVIALAQATGLPIVPYSCRLGWKIRLRSWDAFEIPLPFSRCEISFGEPLHVPREAGETERAFFREALQSALLAGTREERSAAA